MKRILLFCLFCVSAIFAFSQNITVTGKVTDTENAPVSGATVQVKGASQFTVTADDGSFSISVARGATLIFTSVGYSPKEVVVKNNVVNVTIAKTDNAMEEIVVTALGIKKEKRALGYAVTEVKGEELTQARTVNVANSLVGKVAGLNIVGTATGPGGSSRITIRGNTSISGNNQPLIVVDGVPLNNDNLGSAGMWGGADNGDGISSLNPDEIESVSVLKGGTAAALYGSRASNGAILVTTKGGGKGIKGIGIELNSNFMAEDLLFKEYKDYQYEYGIGDNGVKPTSANPNLNQTNSFGAKLDGSDVIQYDGVSRPYVAVRDNLKNFYNVGTTLTNSVAFSGATDKLSYRFSLNDLQNQGIVPNNSLRRNNFAANVNAVLSKRWSFLLNVKYIKEKNKNRPRLSDSPGNANYTLSTMPTSLSVETFKQSKYNDLGYERIWSDNQYVQNPYFATEDFQQQDTKDRWIAAFEPKFNITDWLFLRGRIGFDKYTYRNRSITPTGTGFQLGGSYSTALRDFNERNTELVIGLDKNIGEHFKINALAGGNMMKQVHNNEDYNGSPFNIPFFYDISNTNPAQRGLGYAYVENRINSIFGSADLSFNNYLYLNATARNDWFSALAPGKNSIFYPSVGLSAILSDAFTLPAFVNYAKVRTSWAQVGGGALPYQLNLNYSLTGNHIGAPLGQINQSQVPNDLLQPYVQTSYEAGIEGRFFNNRIGIDFAIYSRKTTKDIVGASISATSGYNNALFNVGEVSNKGVELLLNYKLIDNKNFSWDFSFNMGYNKNRVENLYGSLERLQVDEPRSRSVFVYQQLNSPFALIMGNAFMRDDNGQVIYDAQGFPKSQALHEFGSGIAPFTGGINNSFRFRGIGVSFLVDGKFGGFIYSGTNALAYRYGLHKETLPGRETGVVGEGVNEAGEKNTVNVPAPAYYNRMYEFAEPFVYKSDFIKLRQVIIDYTLPSKILGKSFVKGASVSLVGRNLWIIMKHTPNIDPESTYNNSNAQGFEFAGLPPTRSIGLNLNLKF